MGVIYFLQGICELAVEGLSAARESFMQSYANDSQWVDAFLQTQGHECAYSFGASLKVIGTNYGAGLGVQKSLGQPQHKNLTICLFPEANRMSAHLPPKSVTVQDVVFLVRPSCAWPDVPPPDLSPKVDLSLMRFAQHHEIPFKPAVSW